MKITIDTYEPMSPTEIAMLEVLLDRKRSGETAEYRWDNSMPEPKVDKPEASAEAEKPKAKAPKPRKAKKDETPAEEPEAKPEPAPEAAESEEPAEDFETLLEQATELATEIMNTQGKAPVRKALKSVDASRVSDIEDAATAAKFLAALKAEADNG